MKSKTTVFLNDCQLRTADCRLSNQKNQIITEDRSEKEIEVNKQYAESVDKYGTWLKKYHVTDEEGFLPGVFTTTTFTNETSNLEEVSDTDDLPEGIPLKADKDYQSKKKEGILKKKRLKKQKRTNPSQNRKSDLTN